jgi:hypothetical protein
MVYAYLFVCIYVWVFMYFNILIYHDLDIQSVQSKYLISDSRLLLGKYIYINFNSINITADKYVCSIGYKVFLVCSCSSACQIRLYKENGYVSFFFKLIDLIGFAQLWLWSRFGG